MKQNNWHYARPLLAKKYLDLFEIGLTSARGLFARRRMGKTEFLKKDFIPAAEKAGYIVVYTNLWELEIDPATALVSELYRVIGDLHGQLAMKKIGVSLGLGSNVKKNTIQNALRRLANKNLITKLEYGIYQFEDEAYSDWVKHLDGEMFSK
ncbi:MAG: hypothetical protein H0U70_00550 [Tatlockia sp.]|nr:hypothetical protein [Tatlockia sp.]